MTIDSRETVTEALRALSLPDNRVGLEGTAKAHLDFLLLALEALNDEGSEAILAVASEIGLESILTDRVTLWRLRNANPLRKKGSSGRKKVDIDEIRALALTVCAWSRQQHSCIRTTLERLEICIAQELSPLKDPAIADFLDGFHTCYRDRMIDGDSKPHNDISELALSLLVELLFYGSRYGPQRLWGALLARPEQAFPEDWDAPTELEPSSSASTSSSIGDAYGDGVVG